jgi:hypothetical protein
MTPSTPKRRHKWGRAGRLDEDPGRCYACYMVREVRGPGRTLVYRIPGGKTLVEPDRVPPCQPPKEKP